MARCVPVIRLVSDTRQFQRELAKMTGAQKAYLEQRLEAGLPIAWLDEEQDGSTITLTPRLCCG